MVALDPGVRSFQTFYSPFFAGKFGEKDFGRIHRLCFYLDRLMSKISKSTYRQKCRLKKAAGRIREKIRSLVKELHYKTAHWLCKTFDAIVLPSFETSQMVSKLRSKTARAMLSWSHYRFKQFLKHKCEEMDVLFIEANEAYTSKTVSWTGEIIENLGGRKTIKSVLTGLSMDRDYNGARGIFLRALVDSPSQFIIYELSAVDNN